MPAPSSSSVHDVATEVCAEGRWPVTAQDMRVCVVLVATVVIVLCAVLEVRGWRS